MHILWNKHDFLICWLQKEIFIFNDLLYAPIYFIRWPMVTWKAPLNKMYYYYYSKLATPKLKLIRNDYPWFCAKCAWKGTQIWGHSVQIVSPWDLCMQAFHPLCAILTYPAAVCIFFAQVWECCLSDPVKENLKGLMQKSKSILHHVIVTCRFLQSCHNVSFWWKKSENSPGSAGIDAGFLPFSAAPLCAFRPCAGRHIRRLP